MERNVEMFWKKFDNLICIGEEYLPVMKDETKQTKIQEYTFKKSPNHYRTFPWILLYIITHVQNTLK